MQVADDRAFQYVGGHGPRDLGHVVQVENLSRKRCLFCSSVVIVRARRWASSDDCIEQMQYTSEAGDGRDDNCGKWN